MHLSRLFLFNFYTYRKPWDFLFKFMNTETTEYPRYSKKVLFLSNSIEKWWNNFGFIILNEISTRVQ